MPYCLPHEFLFRDIFTVPYLLPSGSDSFCHSVIDMLGYY